MVNSPPHEAERDQLIGRRAAFGVLGVVAAAIIVGPGLTVVNLITVLVTGATPNETGPLTGSSRRNTLARWQGILPIDVPWWGFLAVSLAFAVVLAVMWPASRRYLGMWRGKVLLIATPFTLACLALLWAAWSLSFGDYYDSADEWDGFLYIPGGVALAVAAAGFVQHRRTRPKLPKRRRKRTKRSAPSQ